MLKILKSRTIWTILALVVINGVPPVRELISPALLPFIDVLLGLLAAYFRVNPKVQF